MSGENTATKPHTESGSSLRQFTIEFGDENSRNMTIVSLGLRVRGRFDRQKLKRGVGDVMSRMPAIPGMHLEVTPGTRTIRLYDPLEKQPELLKTLNSVKDDAPAISRGGNFTFVPSVERKLDPNEFKTLLIDLEDMRKGGMLNLVDGQFPSEQAIQRAEGKQLYDPWNSNHLKPKFAEDAADWERERDQRKL